MVNESDDETESYKPSGHFRPPAEQDTVHQSISGTHYQWGRESKKGKGKAREDAIGKEEAENVEVVPESLTLGQRQTHPRRSRKPTRLGRGEQNDVKSCEN